MSWVTTIHATAQTALSNTLPHGVGEMPGRAEGEPFDVVARRGGPPASSLRSYASPRTPITHVPVHTPPAEGTGQESLDLTRHRGSRLNGGEGTYEPANVCEDFSIFEASIKSDRRCKR